MLVYLLRHGRACPPGAGLDGDAQRDLTDDGRAALAASLREEAPRLLRPERILHSPYRRARQSAEVLAAVLGFTGPLEATPQLLSEADPAAILPDLQAAASAGGSAIALVGHEPHLGRLLGRLVTGTDAAIAMSVGMLAAVQLQGSASLWGRLLLVRPAL
jgi:phosphohistidine phosphatase